MKKGTKVRIVNPNANEDYNIGDVLTYEERYSFKDNVGFTFNLWPSEYEVIEEELPRMVQGWFYGTASMEVELIATYKGKYLCRICGDEFKLLNKITEIEIQSEHKEMTIEEIQKELGYKIKVVE